MTEQELIELLETHFPDELTGDIINRLKTLLRTSPRMRQAILATLKLEQALSAKYSRGGHFRVFMRKVQVVAAAQRRANRIKTAIVLAAVILVVVGGALTAWLTWGRGAGGQSNVNSGNGGIASNSGGPAGPGQQTAAPGSRPSGGDEPRQGGEYNPTNRQAAAAPWRFFDYPLVMEERGWRGTIDQLIKPVSGPPLVFPERSDLIPADGKYKFLILPGPEKMLRLGIRESGWKINIFSDKEAVQIRTLPNDDSLYGYLAERGPENAAVNCRAFSFDWSLRGRMNYSPLDVQYHKGKITVSSGGIPLMSLPLSRPPTDMYFEGKTRFYFMDARLAAPPSDDAAMQIEPARNDTPDKFAWKLEPPDGWNYVKGKDGCVEISAGPKDVTRIAIMDYQPAPGDDIIFRIDSAGPGTGVVVRDLNTGLSYPMMVYNFQSQRVFAGNLNDFSMDKTRTNEIAKILQDGKIVNESFWVRFQVGLYTLAILVSHDGENWWRAWFSHMQDESTRDRLAVGLATKGADQKQKIKLGRVIIRKYDAVKKLYDLSLVDVVAGLPGFKKAKDMPDVENDLISAKPAGVPDWKWRSACMAAMMLKPVSNSVRHQCLLELMGNSVRNHYSPDEVTTAILQMPAWIAWRNPFASIANLYDDLAQRQGPDHYQRLFELWMANIPKGAGDRESMITPPQLTREYLLQLWVKQDWDRLRMATLQLLFFDDRWMGREERKRCLYSMCWWLNAMAWMKLPEQGVTAPTFAGSWNPPLQVSASRETLNAISEFETAVQAGAGEFDAAIRVLIRQPLGDDLVPGGLEEQLYSLPETAVRRIIDGSADFQQALKGRLAGLGLIMLNKARQEQDIASIRTVSVLFAGTQSGSDALEYLADRDLLIGNYASAASYYRQLQSDPGRSPGQSVTAKHRLAAAMMGEQAGKPVTVDVVLPGGKLSAQEFESVISALGAQQGQSLGNLVADRENAQAPAPGPCEMDFKVIGQAAPPTEIIKNDYQSMVGWGYTAAWAPGGDRLFINTAGRLAAIGPQDAGELWVQQQSYKPPLQNSGYNDYCRPLVAGDAIFTRLLREGQMTLVCANAGSGALKWQSRLDDGVVCDPFVVSPWLYVLTRKNVVGELVDICLHRISPKTGESVQGTRVFRMRQGNWPLRIGQPTICGDLIVFRTVGAAVCCDMLGKPRWVRQLPFVPPDVYDEQYQNLAPGPVVAGEGAIYFIASGCPYVMALDLATGKLIWQHQNAAARRIIGLFGKKLVVATAEEIIALDIRSGQCDWRQELPVYDSAVIPAEGDSLMLVKLRHGPGNLTNILERNYVAWISVSDGKTLKLVKLPDGQVSNAINLYVYKKAVYGLCHGASRESRDNRFQGNIFVLKKK
ncbi:MAG: PQQ-binding-like beta-propeller repeat protein [Planctomycetes bacterium]|nr:PQQ-binding-like beta-propeller repeat protein [Planctomycetota bacterium]